MPDEILISYAQNGEDIVLWRALGHIPNGIYVDVGGWDPDVDSVTRLFYERGWRGVDVEPIPEFAEKFRERRPLNDVVQAVITDDDLDQVVLHRFGTTGLSTIDDHVAERHERAGLEQDTICVPACRLDDVLANSTMVGETIHFHKIDVEGAEEKVLRSVDLARWRPWVLVVEATEPNATARTHASWEPILLAAGYTFTLFDGLSRFYVSPEHPELTAALSYPAGPLDAFENAREVELSLAAAALQQELQDARDEATRWHEQADRARSETDELHLQVAGVREKLNRARAQRKQLRRERKRLRARIRRVSRRNKELRQREQASARSVRDRLRSAASKAMGR
jgi:FkbM family methyltransferase